MERAIEINNPVHYNIKRILLAMPVFKPRFIFLDKMGKALVHKV